MPDGSFFKPAIVKGLSCIDCHKYMLNYKLRLGLILFIVGFIGVLSILTARLPLENIPEQVLQQFSKQTLKLLSLINPTFMLMVAVVVGSLLHEQVNLQVPTLEQILKGKKTVHIHTSQLGYGVAGGAIAGILLLLVSEIFASSLPEEFVELGSTFTPTPAMRFLYGGITEEIIMRFGLMTLVVWGNI
jgi:hypothetical protein